MITENQECSMSLTAAANPSAPDRQLRRDRNCRFLKAFTARGKRSGMPAVLAALLLATSGAWAQNVFTPQPVGVSTTQTVTVTAPSGGTVNSVEVLTLGAPNLDFQAGVVFSCVSSVALPVDGTCHQSVTFKPTAPGLRVGAVVLLDGGGSILATAYLSGIGLGGLGVLVPGNPLPVAGDGAYKDAVANGIPAMQAELYLPSGVTVDGAGNLYIADTLHNMIRMVCAGATSATISGTTCTGAGIITTITGNGAAGYGGDSGPAVEATLSSPSGVALDGAGNLYIADTGSNVVRMIRAATGNITTVAGDGTAGYRLTDDGGLATTAELDAPQGVTLDSGGNLYIADTYNQRIRRVDALSGIITTVAGDGTAGYRLADDGGHATNAELNFPDAVAFDSQGNWYIADSLNNRIREVNAGGIISTLAGNGVAGYRATDNGGPGSAAELDAPSGVAVDPAGNVYIADTQNNAIRKVSSAASSAPGIISTIVINGAGVSFYDGIITPVYIHGPLGLFLDSHADLYFADALNMRVWEIQSNFAALNFTVTPIREGSESAPQSQTVENDGNAALNLTAPDIFVDTNDPTGFVNAALATPPTTCPTSIPFLAAVDDECVIGAVFAPSLSLTFGVGVSSEPLDANIYIGALGDTVNSPLDIELVGIATSLNSTTVTLTSSLDPSDFGQNVTFTATVTTGTGALSTSSTVTFYDGATQLGVPVDVNSSGVATLTIPTLTVGSHPITATYSGDSQHFGSTGTLTPKPDQVVNEATATVLQSSGSPSAQGASVIFTATVTIPGGGVVPLDGTVTFTSGATTLCSNVTLTFAAGTYSAACSTTALAQGSDTITATYSGDAAKYILGSSGTLPQDVQASSTITIGSSGSPSYFGNPVTFTVSVTTVGTVPATGTVNFYMAGQIPPLNATPLPLTNVGGTGVVRFTTSSLPVSTVAAPDIITASYAGDSNYVPIVSAPVDQVVNQATISTAVSSLPNPGIAGGAEAITATVTVTGGVSTPRGNVIFTADGTTNLGTAALNGAGTATVNPTLALGLHSIVANYQGDTNDAASTGSLSLTVAQAATTTTLTSSGSPSLVLAPLTFTAVVASIGGGTPTGSVTFTQTPSGGTAGPLSCTNANAGTLVAGTATCTTSALMAGTYSITATYTGDANDTGSTSSPFSQVVGKIPTLTGLGSATTGTGANQQLILVATVVNDTTSTGPLPTPTGTVTFYLNSITGTELGFALLDSTGVATLPPENLTANSYTIVAVYSGDTYHLPSTSSLATVNNTTAFTLTVTPPSVSVVATQNITVNVALTSLSGFTDTIGLGCASLPAGVNCHFSTPTITLPANGAENVSLTIDTNNPLGGGSSAMNERPGGRGVSLAGLILPMSVFFGCVFWRFRRRYTLAMTTGLVLLLGVAAMLVTGCSGFSQSSATPGTYVIQVTGVGSSSDITRYQNVTLTITQ
jgi:sugar lactone lactonase YvrE